MTAGAILARVLPLALAVGVIVALVSLYGAPSWAVGLCGGVLVLLSALATWRIMNPRTR